MSRKYVKTKDVALSTSCLVWGRWNTLEHKAKGEYLLTASVFSEKLLGNAISPDTSNQFTAKLITYLLFDFDLLSRNVLQGVPAESVGRMVSRSSIMDNRV